MFPHKKDTGPWSVYTNYFFAFNTHAGRMGVLELLEAKAGSFKLRYKLVQGGASSAATSQPSSSAVSGDR